MRGEEFWWEGWEKVSVGSIKSVWNEKGRGRREEKGGKRGEGEGWEGVEVCEGEVVEGKVGGIESEGEKREGEVGGVDG